MPNEMPRPTNEMELNQQLASTIGEAVEQLMNGSGWTEANNSLIDPRNFRQPETPPSGGDQSTQVVTPTPGQPVTEVKTTTASPLPFDPEAYKAANGKYLGKYDTVDQFIKGIGHAMNMTKDVLSENDRLNQQIAELRRTPVAPQVTVPQPTSDAPTRGNAPKASPKLAEVLASLQEGTLDAEGLLKLVDAISEHSTEVARSVAREETMERERVAQANTERWNQVDSYMGEKYPNSMNFTSELGVFTKATPEVNQVVSALIEKNLHEQAMEYAWQRFSISHGIDPLAFTTAKPFVAAPPTKENVEKEIKLDAANQVRKEAVEAARRDAGVIPSMTGGVHGVHENANAGPSVSEMDEAAALMRNGNGERWRSLAFKDILNHPLFN